ncbi:WXG100 family type VII secretion target [Kineosporia babensis]|uniref:Putative T7SS secretion signal domain-containing protein n=1 Tax=Kineosporia babensis TaxID=499548 RepID=A0A9X1NM35_9ACTN|nr:hypothetical protein [Kineosporia babensis]MCD5316231.1 hypothetical protein [Kineosporia babensis]
MSRPADWSPLAAADPVPGDEYGIRSMSRRYQAFADELEQQATTLTRLASDEYWDADAGRVFASTGTELAGQLRKAKSRYESVSAALSTYANGLTAAQQEADAALTQAKQIEAEEQAKERARNAAAAAEGVKPGAAADGSDQNQADVMNQALAGARSRMQRAIDQKDAAGRAAASRVREAIDNDGLRDTWWDKTSNWTGKNWDSFVEWVHSKAPMMKEITKWAGYIGTALSVAGMVIALIPGVNALAPVLFAAAAVLTLVSLVCNILMTFSGDASIADVALDLFGLATFGYGRVAAGGIRGAQQALKGSAKDILKREARKRGESVADQILYADKKIAAAAGGKLKSPSLENWPLLNRAQSRVDKVAQPLLDKASAQLNRMNPTMEKWGSTRVGKYLGMDSEIVMTKSGLDGVRNLMKPGYDPANEAMAALDKVAGKDALVSKISMGVSLGNLPETDMFKPSKQGSTFGRYAYLAS